jgi:glutamine synthetase
VVTVDQHGVPRAKAISVEAAVAALSDGLDFSGAIYSLDSGNTVFVPAFSQDGGLSVAELTGFPDVVLLPDPTTFHVLPWASKTGWMLSDAYFANGTAVPFDGRHLLREALRKLEHRGLSFVSGLEVEFLIARSGRTELPFSEAGFSPPTPPVTAFQPGYQFLSEVRLDLVSETLERIRDALIELGLAPRSMEDEWGPGQMEFTFSPITGIAGADAMVLFRSAVKQLCQRLGLVASFMCRPGFESVFSSGWHLHQSLNDENGHNVFASDVDQLSVVGRNFVGGLLDHAGPMCVFSTPTVNGYKRYRPYSFAPDRICWGFENRGTLIRVQGGVGDSGTHIENRIGEPAANPYLYFAADIEAGLDGLESETVPPPPIETDPYASASPPLPKSLSEAVAGLERDSFYRRVFGDLFVDYLVMMKRAEVSRYESWCNEHHVEDDESVTEWENREYFEFY